MINQWKIAENGGVGKSVPEKCKTPQSFTLKSKIYNKYITTDWKNVTQI